MTLFSRLASFHCPSCAVLLPAFAILTTLPGGAVNVKIHDHMQCGSCQSLLRLKKSGAFSPRLIAGVFHLLSAVVLLASTLAVFATGARLGGIWGAGLAGCLWFFSGAYFLGALRARVLKNFVEVEIVT